MSRARHQKHQRLYVIRGVVNRCYWMHDGTFVISQDLATLFRTRRAAELQARNFIPDEVEVCVITKRGPRKVNTCKTN